MNIKTKKCYSCKIEQDITNFNKSIKESGGYSYQCKTCKREDNLIARYGINSKQYNEMFNEQNGCCAICNKHQSELKRTLNVDHNHNTKEVRGLLCNLCNRAIGFLQDDVNIVKKVVKYLDK